jgi:hypothetical protein
MPQKGPVETRRMQECKSCPMEVQWWKVNLEWESSLPEPREPRVALCAGPHGARAAPHAGPHGAHGGRFEARAARCAAPRGVPAGPHAGHSGSSGGMAEATITQTLGRTFGWVDRWAPSIGC